MIALLVGIGAMSLAIGYAWLTGGLAMRFIDGYWPHDSGDWGLATVMSLLIHLIATALLCVAYIIGRGILG